MLILHLQDFAREARNGDEQSFRRDPLSSRDRSNHPRTRLPSHLKRVAAGDPVRVMKGACTQAVEIFEAPGAALCSILFSFSQSLKTLSFPG